MFVLEARPRLDTVRRLTRMNLNRTTYGQITFPCYGGTTEFSVIERTSRMDGEGARPSLWSAPANLQERLWCSIGHVCRGA